MNCEQYDDLLDDYVDGARAAHRRADERFVAFEQHLAHCVQCRALVADLTSIRLAASTLEEYVPPPRLWAKISSSIDEQQRQSWWQRPLADGFSAWIPAAVAASIVALLAGGVWMTWQRTPAEGPQQVSAPADLPRVPAERHYEQAIAGLQQLADAQNAALDPDTRAVLSRNLAVIDRAITESRAALEQEPASTLAQESLLDALETKVALLQDTVALASDVGAMPDEPEGAAKELTQ